MKYKSMGMKKKFSLKNLLRVNLVFNGLFLTLIIGTVYIVSNKIKTLKNSEILINRIDNCFQKIDNLKYKITDEYFTDPGSFQTLKITNFKNEIGKVKFDFILANQKINKTKFFVENKNITFLIDSLKVLLNNQINTLNIYLSLIEKRGSELTNGVISMLVLDGEKIFGENKVKDASIYQIRILEAKSIYGGVPLNWQLINSLTKKLELSNKNILNSYLTNLQELDIINKQLGLGNRDESSIIYNYYKNQKAANKLLLILKNNTNDIIAYYSKIYKYFLIIFVILIVLIYIFVYKRLTTKLLIRPINTLLNNTSNLSKGFLETVNVNTYIDEFSRISDNIYNITESQKNRLEFIKALNFNNFEVELPLAGEDDILNKELNRLKEVLKIGYEEKIKHDEENRIKRYINEGIAKFSEIAHSNYGNLSKLTDAYIKELTKYLDVVQGGIYLIDDNDPDQLFLISAFAYDRKKFLNKTYKIGEGLVGTCALEKKILIIDNVPESYIKITSGLGDTPPQYLYIVPMLHNDDLIGVIEIASLKPLKDYEIDFAQQAAGILAISIANEKINEQTRKLLEQTREQAAKMKEQEEEMRQNLEELQASQEEFSRREENLKGMLNALNQSWLIAELDNKGRFTTMNLNFLITLGKTLEEVIGKKYIDVINGKNSNLVDENFINEVLQGKQLEHEEILNFGKKQSKLILKFVPVYNNMELPIKILCTGYEIQLY